MEDNNWNQFNKMAAATVSGVNNELLASFFSSFVREPQIIHNLLLLWLPFGRNFKLSPDIKHKPPSLHHF